MIRTLDAIGTMARLPELSDILVDAVANGASVNFMAGFTHQAAETLWRTQVPGIANNEKQLLIAEHDNRLIATVMVMFAQQPNAPHRAFRPDGRLAETTIFYKQLPP